MWFRFKLWFLQLLGRDPRGLFRFWNGRRWVSVDPLPAARVLMTHQKFDWNKTPKLTNDDDPETVSEAIQTSAEAARDAFGIPAFTAGGLTETECCRILWAFMDYMTDLKKNGSGPPTSPEPTAPRPLGESATNAESVSGSIGSELVFNEPGT